MKNKNIFKRVGNYLTEVKGEIKKVTWPNQNDLVKTTIAVLVSSFIFGVFLFVVDMFFSRVIREVIGIFK